MKILGKFLDMTSEDIMATTLKPIEIFVFGSNLKGIHGAGAALHARKYHGAILGQGSGLQGNSYAIPTVYVPMRPLPLETIGRYVDLFRTFAAAGVDRYIFNVTPIGCGLAGYKPYQIAPLFVNMPSNVKLPVEFTSIIHENIKNPQTVESIFCQHSEIE